MDFSKTVVLRLFLSLLTMAGADLAFASESVTCTNGDCLKFGWFSQNSLNREWADTRCFDQDCLNKGWLVSNRRGVQYSAFCLEGGCFKTGWVERDRQGREFTFLCRSGDDRVSDCLTRGWYLASSQYSVRATCNNSACATEGWVVEAGFGQRSLIVCNEVPGELSAIAIRSAANHATARDCFHYGWNVYN